MGRLCQRFDESLQYVFPTMPFGDEGSNVLENIRSQIISEIKKVERTVEADKLFKAIEQGDDEHREWWRKKLNEYFEVKP